jgi:hypothetical protein
MTDQLLSSSDFIDEIAESTETATSAVAAVGSGQPKISRKRKPAAEPLTKSEIDALITEWTKSGLSINKMVSELATRGTRISSPTVRARMQALGLKSMNKPGPSRESIAKGPWLNQYVAEIEGLAKDGATYARIWHELRTNHPGDPMLARALSDNVKSSIISTWVFQERKKAARQESQQALPVRKSLLEPIRKMAPALPASVSQGGFPGYPGYPGYPAYPGMPGPAYMAPPPGYVPPSPAPVSVKAPGVTAPASKVSKAAAAPAKKSISVPASDDSSTPTDSAVLDSLSVQDGIKAQNEILAAKTLQTKEAAKEAAAANPRIKAGQERFLS